MQNFRIELGQPITTQPEGQEAAFIEALEANKSSTIDIEVTHHVKVGDVMEEQHALCVLMPFVSPKGILHWEIIPKNPEMIGKGAFGTVTLSLGSIEISILQSGGKGLVFSKTMHPVKTMTVIYEHDKRILRKDIADEVELSKLAGVAKGSFDQSFIMDQMVMRDLGDDWDQLKFDKLSAAECIYLAAGGMHSLKKISEKGIAHDDIKEENLFFGRDFLIYLGDFGLSHSAKIPDKCGGTPFYSAPEVTMLPMDRNTKSDVFSLAIVILNVFTKFGLEKYLKSEKANLCDFLFNGHYLSLRKAFAIRNNIFGNKSSYSDTSFPRYFISFCVNNWFLPKLKNKCLPKEKQLIVDTLLQCLDFYPERRSSPEDAFESFIWIAFRLFAREMELDETSIDQINLPKQYYYPLLNIFLLLQYYNLLAPGNFLTIFKELTQPKILPNIALIQKTIHLINKRFDGDDRSWQLMRFMCQLVERSDICLNTLSKFHDFVKSLKRQNVTLAELEFNAIIKQIILTEINNKVQELCLRSGSSDRDEISPKASLALQEKYEELVKLRQNISNTNDFVLIKQLLTEAATDPRITSLIGAGYCLTIFGKSSDTKVMLLNMEKLLSFGIELAPPAIPAPH